MATIRVRGIDNLVEDVLRQSGPMTSNRLSEALSSRGVDLSRVRNALWRLRRSGRVVSLRKGGQVTYHITSK